MKLDKLLIAVFSFMLAIIFIIIDTYDFSSQIKTDLLLIVVYVILMIYFFILYFKLFGRQWYYPFPMLFIAFSLYFVLGVLFYHLRNFNYYYSKNIETFTANFVVFISLISICFSFLFFSKWSYARKLDKKIMPRPLTLDSNKLNITVLVIAIIGYIFSLLFFDFFREIPLFSNNIDSARTSIMAKRGVYLSGVMLLIHAFVLNFIRILLIPNKRFINYAFAFISSALLILPLTFYGGRFLIMSTLILCGLVYTIYFRKMSLIIITSLVSILIIGAVIYVGYRIYGSNVDGTLLLNAIYSDFFPEMRLFSEVLARKMQVGDYFIQVFVTPIVGILPSFVLNLFGFSKENYWQPIGKDVMSFFPEAEDILGIRISFVGEVYMASGYVGVILVMFALGYILSRADSKFQQEQGIKKYPYIILSGLFPLLFPYGSIFSATIFLLFVESLVVSKFISSYK